MMSARASNLSGSGLNRLQTRFAPVFLLFCFSALAHAGSVSLEWDKVSDERVDHYEVAYGVSSGKYDATVVSTETSVSISGLNSGSTYYLAARACDKAKTYCSVYSNEVVAKIPSSALKANFTASVVSGVAPLTVTFLDQSVGDVSRLAWDFGDGTTGGASTSVHTYTKAGNYKVKLTVASPSGTSVDERSVLIQVASAAAAADGGASGSDYTYVIDWKDASSFKSMVTFPIETGEVAVDSDWVWVDFKSTFIDPVVVVKGLSDNDPEPAVARVKGVTPNGFFVRVQEWDYLDDVHDAETITYLAMERGRYQLPDGAWVEAGSLETKATNAFRYQLFESAFGEVPVVFVSVVTTNEIQAVTSRLRQISSKGFFVGMREQEANVQIHARERIDYIAWEPSSGVIDGLKYEVGRTDSVVTHSPYQLPFGVAFEREPMLIADIQTIRGRDPSVVRWNRMESEVVDLWVQEEQSRDAEMAHMAEVVGYFAVEIQE